MCIYSRFRFLCMHEKLKISEVCEQATYDQHGELFCRHDPDANLNDGRPRTYADRTYGVGICPSIHCAWAQSLLPLGEFGDATTFPDGVSFADDTEIDPSRAARQARVDRWYELLDDNQKLQHYSNEYPLPAHLRSAAGQSLLEHPLVDAVNPVGLKWEELNPQCLHPAALQYCIYSRLLPASIVDDSGKKTVSPLKPIVGPFSIPADHECAEERGICKGCGRNIGDPVAKEATLIYRQDLALAELMREDITEEDARGTAFDPATKLKWDDAESKYIKLPQVYETIHAAGNTPENPGLYSLANSELIADDSAAAVAPYSPVTPTNRIDLANAAGGFELLSPFQSASEEKPMNWEIERSSVPEDDDVFGIPPAGNTMNTDVPMNEDPEFDQPAADSKPPLPLEEALPEADRLPSPTNLTQALLSVATDDDGSLGFDDDMDTALGTPTPASRHHNSR